VLLLQLLLERHAGHVPGSFAELEALHGVGHKTASVVMSQAFGCAGRLGGKGLSSNAGSWVIAVMLGRGGRQAVGHQ
jgi:hypothetical protein